MISFLLSFSFHIGGGSVPVAIKQFLIFHADFTYILRLFFLQCLPKFYVLNDLLSLHFIWFVKIILIVYLYHFIKFPPTVPLIEENEDIEAFSGVRDYLVFPL